MRILALLVFIILSACSSAPNSKESAMLNDLAANYVKLTLEIDAHEPGYVDAYFGPAEWREAAKAGPRSVETLHAAAEALEGKLAALVGDSEQGNRARVLKANVGSAKFRLEMIGGKRVPFVEEAERLFSMRPVLQPLSYYDAVLERIEALAPGEGPLGDRVERVRATHVIPPDRLQAVMDAAIAECRARTKARMKLPEGEAFNMSLAKDKPWGAYNYYQGGNQSLIEINTDLPVSITRAIVLACHEGYPGHHVQGINNEKLYREKGWVEFSVAPLYAPASPLNEGGADFAIKLAFPGEERAEFEARVLYPLAGLNPKDAHGFEALETAMGELVGAGLTIDAQYLDGEITRTTAVRLLQEYQLSTERRAEQALKFADAYRSYVINYSGGEALVSAYVDRVAGNDVDKRWAAYEGIMTRPTLPSDLAAR